MLAIYDNASVLSHKKYTVMCARHFIKYIVEDKVLQQN